MSQETTVTAQEVLAQAQVARDAAQWEKAITLYQQIEKLAPESAELKHLSLIHISEPTRPY